MHPAYSVIVFTTFSGAGYGLLTCMALFGMTGGVPADRWFGVAGFVLALGMITGGLLSSTFHLGHPERAWRALSQWRSSWLSREGVLALFTYLPALLLAYWWIILGSLDGAANLFAMMTIVFSVMTVVATGMIYASLRTIRAWFNPNTVRVYLAFALWTGSLWFNMLAHFFGVHSPWIGVFMVIAGVVALFFKRKYWIFIDSHPTWVPPESALGLPDAGPVRQLDPPNTQENYVQKEMGYQVARTHAFSLRRTAFFCYFLIPWGVALITIEHEPWIRYTGAVVAVIVGMAGTMVERWLFFAEAKHTANLYYGADSS
jgi:DMSO reductase anchor subunit